MSLTDTSFWGGSEITLYNILNLKSLSNAIVTYYLKHLELHGITMIQIALKALMSFFNNVLTTNSLYIKINLVS